MCIRLLAPVSKRRGLSDFLAGATVLDQRHFSTFNGPARRKRDDSPKVSLEFHESDPTARFHRSVSSIELALIRHDEVSVFENEGRLGNSELSNLFALRSSFFRFSTFDFVHY